MKTTALCFLIALCIFNAVQIQAALDAPCELKHSQQFTLQAYGARTINIKSSFSAQDAVIIRPTTQATVTLDVEIYTSDLLESSPLAITTSQNATVLVVESNVKVSSVSGSSPSGPNGVSPNLPYTSSSPSAVSSSSVIRNTLGVLSTGLLLALTSKNKFVFIALCVIVTATFSMEDCSRQVRFILTVPETVVTVCLNDQCMTSSPSINFGVTIPITYFTPTEEELQIYSDAFGIVRKGFDWGWIELSQGVYSLDRYTTFVESMKRYGRPFHFNFFYGNPFYDSGAAPTSARAIEGFVNYTEALLDKYSGLNVMWEMWNEPNIAAISGNFASVADFIPLARATAQNLRLKHNNEFHMGPTMGEIKLPLIELCFQEGLLEYWDAVSVHPYRYLGVNPEDVVREYRDLALLIEQYRPANRPFIPIASSEWGYSTTEYSERVQGLYITRMYLTNMANDIIMSSWYNFNDLGADQSEREYHFGTIRYPYQSPFQFKPSYIAARALQQVSKGLRFNKRIYTDSESQWIVVMSNASDVSNMLIAVWSTSDTAETVSLDVSPGQFRITNHWGDETTDVTVNSGEALVIQATDEVQYIVPKTANPYLQLIGSVSRPPLMITERSKTFPIYVTNPLEESVTLDFYDNTGVTVAPGQTVTLWHTVDAKIDVSPYDLPIFVNFTSYPVLQQQTHVRPFFAASPVIYPTTVNGSVPVGAISEATTQISLTAQLSVTVNSKTFTRDVTLTADQSAVMLVDGQISTLAGTTDIVIRLLGDDHSYFTENTKVASQYPDFSTFTASTLQSSFSYYTGGDDGTGKLVFDLNKPQTMPFNFDSYGIVRLSFTVSAGFRYFSWDVKSVAPIGGAPTRFGQWICGTASNAGYEPALRVKDKNNEIYQMKTKINWLGWNYVVYNLEDSTFFQGDGNGVVDYPLSWQSLFVSSVSTNAATTAVFYATAPVAYNQF